MTNLMTNEHFVPPSQGFHRVDFYKSLVDEWPSAKDRAGTGEVRTLPELIDMEVSQFEVRYT